MNEKLDCKKILFLGDLFYNYDSVAEDIEELSEWIKENNCVTVLNMEGVIKYDKGTPIEKRGPNLASDESIIDVLKKLNTVGVCLANNHTMDFDREALLNTIKLLDENGIKHCGAGENLKSALKPMGLDINGEKIAVLNFGWDIEETVYADENTAGCAPRDEKIILNAVKNSVLQGYRVAASLHWGFEYNRLPMPFDISLAHKLIDNGCELVIGHHPHCVQPMEKYKDSYIYYSLGNFYFAGRRERFKKEFAEDIKNQSDYGVMAVYDTENKTMENHLIFYNRDKKRSEIIACNDNKVLENISGVDFNSQEYLKKAQSRKVNINPVLTLDDAKNNRELKKLFAKYNLKKTVKKLLGRG